MHLVGQHVAEDLRHGTRVEAEFALRFRIRVDIGHARDDTADVSLRQMTPDAARTLYGLSTGKYVAYSIQGAAIKLWPEPEATSTDTIIIRYQQTIPALSASELTNWLIDSYPDVYYYGLLVQSEAYIVNDERVGMWKAAFDESLSELGLDAKRRRYGASPLVAYPYSYA